MIKWDEGHEYLLLETAADREWFHDIYVQETTDPAAQVRIHKRLVNHIKWMAHILSDRRKCWEWRCNEYDTASRWKRLLHGFKDPRLDANHYDMAEGQFYWNWSLDYEVVDNVLPCRVRYHTAITLTRANVHRELGIEPYPFDKMFYIATTEKDWTSSMANRPNPHAPVVKLIELPTKLEPRTTYELKVNQRGELCM